MKFIIEYNNYEPDDNEIKKWMDYLNKNYTIQEYDSFKLIQIDDKPYYLTGWTYNKGKLTNKLYYDILLYNENIHKPSLRKAIKNWIENNN